ncbi:putative F-box protein [Iris pallida]|uniref:F-box protein n=1 Tax=Iris pallida TaxID=29817 RepID=A0AAX6FEN3_IRIPA|nr:putative F-box protein [Iris pallida]
MAALQITNYVSSIKRSTPRFRACSLQTPPAANLLRTPMVTTTSSQTSYRSGVDTSTISNKNNVDDKLVIAQLYAVAEAAADRAEMHDIIGKQRDNWNHLLLHSINSITLAASAAAGISAMPPVLMLQSSSPNHLQLAFKLSSALLFAASTAMMTITSKIQPSQLAEEQRNATRLFRQIDKSIHTTLNLAAAIRSSSSSSTPTEADVKVAVERVLALDKAYPLPLLPGMLDKFPTKLEPTVWWPKLNRSRPSSSSVGGDIRSNGWSKGLELEMEGIVAKLRSKDIEQYVHFGNKLLAINRVVAVAGPILCGLAAVGSSMVGVSALGPFPVLLGVVGGALAAVANTLQHAGQAGTVVELSRNCAGFYKNLGEEIEWNLREGEAEKREEGELFKLKVALKLGRTLSDLQEFGRSVVDHGDEANIKGDQFAGKLF